VKVTKEEAMKLSVVILIAIAALVLVSAAPSFAASMEGTYVGTGSGSALFAFCGFNDKGIPNAASGGAYSTLLTNTEGRWTFNPDGTGSLQAKISVISLANPVFPSAAGADGISFPWAGENQATATFSYTLEPSSGKLIITITEVDQEWTAGPLKGVSSSLQPPFAIGSAVVSQDRKSIKFDTHNEIRTLPLTIPGCTSAAQIANQLSHVLLRQDRAPQLIP
jgi:hypothetical protein